MKITEVSVQKNNPLRVNVFVDGEYSFSLDDVDAVTMGIKPGREISSEEIRNCMYESQFGKLRSKALDMLSRKSMTAHMLYEKLSEDYSDEVVVRQVIADLEDMGYIDDMNFASLFMEYAFSKMWGEKKVRYELKQKGVDANIIEDAICTFKLPAEDEIEELIRQKYSGEDLTDFKTKQRIIRFFASRGFDYSMVESVLRNMKD